MAGRVVYFILLLLCSWVRSAVAAEPVQFRSPFHPDECAPAIKEALRQLRRVPESIRWHRVLGQGFLCLGLKDDPVALRRAAEEFESVLRRAPGDVLAAVGLAEARGSQAPASEATLRELRRAHGAVVEAGNAVPLWARQYIERNLEAVAERRSHTEEVSRKDCALEESGAATAQCRRTKILAALERGEAAADEARVGVDNLLRDEGSDSTAIAWMAELVRLSGAYSEAATLFRYAAERVCPRRCPDDIDCVFARQQLAKLAAVCGDWGQFNGEPSLHPPCMQPQASVRQASRR